MRLLDKTKISIFCYLFAFCFIVVYAGNATVFARSLGDIRTVGNAFALVITTLFAIVRKVRFGREFFVVVGVFLVYALTTAIVYRNLNLWWISVHILRLTYAYVLCRGLGQRILSVFETIMFHMSIISLIFWTIMLISPSTLSSIVNTFSFSKPHTEDGNVIANMIIYTLNDWNYGNSDFNLFKRNPGFAWEPGAFAALICLALFCNMIRTGFKQTKNIPLIIFIVTLFSTQSTTGFVIFLIMLITWLLRGRKFGWLLVAVPIVIIVLNLPFIKEKIVFEKEKVASYDINRVSGAQSRFFSLTLDWQEFLRHPVLGLGCNYKNTWLNQLGYDISTISGIGDILSIYGGIITLIFLIMLARSSLSISHDFGVKDGWVLIIVILGAMISYSIWMSPIYIAFWLYCIWGAKANETHKTIV